MRITNEKKSFLLSYFVFMCFTVMAAGAVSSPWYRLNTDLFTNYSKYVMPLVNVTDRIVVQLQIMYQKVVDVDERKQILTSSLWLRQWWRDPFLSWDPQKYEGITLLSVDPSKVWKPDVSVLNRLGTSHHKTLFKLLDTDISIRHNGDMRWSAPLVISTECKLNVHYFPFDEQQCLIVFESWNQNMDTLDLRIKNEDFGVDIESYSESTEWELKGITAQRQETHYKCCDSTFSDVIFKINIKRSPQYFITNIILPCSFIALLSLMSFVLPPDCGERVSFLITILLAMSVYMTIITDKFPPAPGYPIISVFFLSMIIHISCALIANCIVISCHSRKYPMPKFVQRSVNGWLAGVVMLRGKDKTKASYKLKTLNHYSDVVACRDNNGGINNNAMEGETSKTTMVNGSEERAVTRCREELETSTPDEEEEKWSLAARVLDRVFVGLFVLVAILIVMTIIFSVTG